MPGYDFRANFSQAGWNDFLIPLLGRYPLGWATFLNPFRSPNDAEPPPAEGGQSILVLSLLTLHLRGDESDILRHMNVMNVLGGILILVLSELHKMC